MKRVLLSCLFAAAVAAAADQPPATMRVLEPLPDETFVPTRLPGFELREMNQKRDLHYALDSETEVTIHVPVLIYFPTEKAAPKAEITELRALYDDLAQMVVRTHDSRGQELLLRLDRVLADLGEPRQTIGEMPATRRVISEKRIGVPEQAKTEMQTSPVVIYDAPATASQSTAAAPQAYPDPLAESPSK